MDSNFRDIFDFSLHWSDSFLMLQARVPQAHLDVRPDDMPESSEHLETMIWLPNAIMDGDLLMYLRAARYIVV